MKKNFFLFFISLCLITSESHADLSEYKAFAEQTGNEIIQVLVDTSSSMQNRKKKFRAILEKRFSLPSIAKFVLARYWRRTNDQQKARYLDLFEDATVTNYAAQFDNYNNERLEVLSARPGKKGNVIITTRILRPSKGEPLSVDWHAAKSKSGKIKVVDLIINGVSMSITQRSEYGAMVQSANGNIDQFLDNLEAQVRSDP